MITTYERTGKYINKFSMMDLIEEYKKINIESGTLIRNVLKMGVTEEQKEKLEEHCIEYEKYQNELAAEFITRFLK